MDDHLYLTLRYTEETSVHAEDAGEFAYEIDGDILSLGDNDERIPVGKFRTFYVDVDAAADEGCAVFDVLDAEAATIIYYEPIYGGPNGGPTRTVLKVVEEEYFINQNLLILDRLEILPAFRGRNLGLLILRRLIQRFSAGTGVIAMKPFPLQFEAGFRSQEPSEWKSKMELNKFDGKKKATTTKLQAHYARLGFRRVPGTQLMIRPTGLRLPKPSDLTRLTKETVIPRPR